MKRFAWLFVAMLFAVLSVIGSTRGAGADANVVLVTEAVKWDSAGTILEFKTIGDENDSCFTVPINPALWSWDSQGLDAATAHSMARLTFEVYGTNTATDTVNYLVEPSASGGRYVYRDLRNATPSLWNSATSAGDVNTTQFVGFLDADQDLRSADNVHLTPSFRLKVAGDQSGSSAKISRVKLWITYLRKTR